MIKIIRDKKSAYYSSAVYNSLRINFVTPEIQNRFIRAVALLGASRVAEICECKASVLNEGGYTHTASEYSSLAYTIRNNCDNELESQVFTSSLVLDMEKTYCLI